MTDSYDFTADLANRIVEYSQIPKIQVERLVGPILTIFLEDIINQLLGAKDIRLIAPEWPLKKENNQSTNIDWLMIQPSRKRLIAIELKTDAGSDDKEQADTYLQLKKRVRDHGAGYLWVDWDRIQQASSLSWKYEHMTKTVSSHRAAFSDIREIEIVYIAPSSMASRLSTAGITAYGLKDLPHTIDSPRNGAWQMLRPAFTELDSNRQNAPRSASSENTAPIEYDELIPDIQAHLDRDGYTSTPVRIWFGRTGDGSRPNYQIQFSDGTIVPFFNSGKRYERADQFKADNLSEPFEWAHFRK